MKTIAIIIPAFHAEKYIAECIRSLNFQMPVPAGLYDIRIGVDGCKKTASVLDKIHFPYYFSYNNVGAYVMRNSLMLVKPADIYVYFDSDDVMESNFLKVCIGEIEKGHNIVMPGKLECNENLQPKNNNPIIQDGGSMCFTNQVLESLGGFYNARCAADTDFMRRAEMAGYKIHKIPQALYKRRRHNESLTKSGLTAFGGQYRKEIWRQMTADRQKGIVKIIPRITNLEYRNG